MITAYGKDTKYCFRYDNITEIPSVRTTRYGPKSFRYAAAKLWNELPNHFRTQTSFNQFKNLINSWNDNSCRCNASMLAASKNYSRIDIA